MGAPGSGNNHDHFAFTEPAADWPDKLKKMWTATEAAQKKRERLGGPMQMCDSCRSHKAELGNFCCSCFFAMPINQGYLKSPPPAFNMSDATARQKSREREVFGTQMCVLCGRFRAVYGNFCAYCCAAPSVFGQAPPTVITFGQAPPTVIGMRPEPPHPFGFYNGNSQGMGGIPFGDLEALRAATAAEEKRRADLDARVAEKKKRVRTPVVYISNEPLHYPKAGR